MNSQAAASVVAAPPQAAPSTREGLLDVAALPKDALSEAVWRTGLLSVFDTFAVMRAGCGEPASKIARALVLEDAGAEVATLAGEAVRVPARAAALANGTTAHALDYDDTHFGHIGHVSVAVLPAALAMGEAVDASAEDVVAGFVRGAEAACRVGKVLGRAHYVAGFHQTATSGAFGATVAAGSIAGLDGDAMVRALSIVAGRASGLRCQFGTMSKPLNAGIAAQNGVEAVLLAKRGLTAADDGFGGAQGFCATHHGEDDHTAWAEPPPGRFLFTDNRYKLHACCHGTHAMIEALISLVPAIAGRPVGSIIVDTNPRWLSVCDIKIPRTGLEVKFSYAHIAAMVLSGVSTAADETYTDALAAEPALREQAARLTSVGREDLGDGEAQLTVTLADGETLTAHYDLDGPVDLETLGAALRAKAAALIGDECAAAIWQRLDDLDALSARDLATSIAA
ncbi:MAG: MmgE/PrpD family protein [Pseudomonadota bacterium]